MFLTRTTAVRRRPGFTLVELMVAAALSVTIMWILAESFKMGIDFARTARSTGDMMTQLNNAGQIMTRDLQANHFYVSHAGLSSNLGKLSAQRLDSLGSGTNSTNTPATTYSLNKQPNPSGIVAAAGGYNPPQGYFQFYSPPPSLQPVIGDNSEGFQLTTTYGQDTYTNTTTATGPYLRYTVYLPQGLPQNSFTATSATGTTYASQAAEVCYFIGGGPNAQGVPGQGVPTGYTLADQPTTTQVTDLATLIRQENPQLSAAQATTQAQAMLQPQPLYNLYRRQRLVAPNTDYIPTLTPPPNSTAANLQDLENIISLTQTANPLTPANVQVNTLASFGTAPFTINGQPARASLIPTTPLTGTRLGDDLLLSNVLSFEVLATWNPAQALLSNPQMQPQIGNGQPAATAFTNAANTVVTNSNHPFDHLPTLALNPNIPNVFDTWYAINQAYPVPSGNPLASFNWNNFYMYNNPGRLPGDNGKKGKGGTIPNLPNPNLIPMPVRVTALQITIRVYDPRTKMTRQNSWRIAM